MLAALAVSALIAPIALVVAAFSHRENRRITAIIMMVPTFLTFGAGLRDLFLVSRLIDVCLDDSVASYRPDLAGGQFCKEAEDVLF